MKPRDVVLVDGIRTAFGKAGEKGIFWMTRADDMVVKVIRELMRRNPQVKPEMVEENVWGATTQEGDQGLTMGRTTAILAGLPESTAGFSVDRMCAGGMTAVTCAASEIAMGA
ncbi:MAG: acetyl-CoA acetyltransferase, partial [Desulfacinum sp.]|nr:acetyl-CoA acetyltransferase [Desulfacinum sp.]